MRSEKNIHRFQKANPFAAFFLIGFAVLLAVQNPPGYASLAKDEDFGYWNPNDVEKKLNDRWTLKAGEELRYREHQGIYYYETRVGTTYQLIKNLSIGPEYVQARSTRTVGGKSKWHWESCPRIVMTPRLSIKGFSLEDRNMLEFRFKQYFENTVRYRNLFTLTAPWKWTPLEFQPYAANEIFLETDRNGFMEDRFYSGLKVHWWGPFYGTLFYLRHSSKNSQAKWSSLNILGTGFKITL